MKNTFYVMLKALFVLKIEIYFFSRLFSHVGRRLDKKAKVNFKIMTSQTGQQTITIYIFSNISRSEGSQAMKLGQFREYNVRNIFLLKSCIF